MELHQLRYFVAVAQAGNFSRAAERCFVSQPSLSQQIQKLERQLKRPLFHRLGRKAVLTDAGRLLFDKAMQILAGVEDAERRLRGGDDAQSGRLSVGAIPTIAPFVLPDALRRFTKSLPQAELMIREDVTEHLVAAVAEGGLDLAVVALPMEDPRLHVETLCTEPLFLAVPRQHPLAKPRRKVTVQDLVGERFILMGDMHCLGETVLNFCRSRDCQPFIACRSAQISTIQQLIGLGLGISLLPDMARRADTSSTIIYRRLEEPQPERKLAVIWHKHYFHSPLAHKFLAELRLWAKEAGRST